jgi:hypothetical protein
MFPHSDVRPARLEVTFTQFPGDGELRTGGPPPGAEFGFGIGFEFDVCGAEGTAAFTAGSAARDGLQFTCVRSAASKSVAISGADFTAFLRLLVARRIHDSAGASQIQIHVRDFHGLIPPLLDTTFAPATNFLIILP